MTAMNATTGRAGRFSSLRNVISLAGAAVTTGSAVLFAVLFLLQLLGYLTNPYLGLVVFGVLPLLFLLGLLLIPVGIVWARGHVERTLHTWPRLDLNEPRHRWLTSCSWWGRSAIW